MSAETLFPHDPLNRMASMLTLQSSANFLRLLKDRLINQYLLKHSIRTAPSQETYVIRDWLVLKKINDSCLVSLKIQLNLSINGSFQVPVLNWKECFSELRLISAQLLAWVRSWRSTLTGKRHGCWIPFGTYSQAPNNSTVSLPYYICDRLRTLQYKLTRL